MALSLAAGIRAPPGTCSSIAFAFKLIGETRSIFHTSQRISTWVIQGKFKGEMLHPVSPLRLLRLQICVH